MDVAAVLVQLLVGRGMAAFIVTVEGLVGRGIDVIFVLVLVWDCCGMNEVVVSAFGVCWSWLCF